MDQKDKVQASDTNLNPEPGTLNPSEEPRTLNPITPPRQTHHVDAGMDLYALEADAFAAIVLDGQSPFITQEQTLTTMRILDTLRGQLGIPLATGN
jgi:predicted dehydrogenase